MSGVVDRELYDHVLGDDLAHRGLEPVRDTVAKTGQQSEAERRSDETHEDADADRDQRDLAFQQRRAEELD